MTFNITELCFKCWMATEYVFVVFKVKTLWTDVKQLTELNLQKPMSSYILFYYIFFILSGKTFTCELVEF